MDTKKKKLFWLGLGLSAVLEVFFVGGIFPLFGIKLLPLINTGELFGQYPELGFILLILEIVSIGTALFINFSYPYKNISVKYLISAVLGLLLICSLTLLYIGYVFAYKVSFP